MSGPVRGPLRVRGGPGGTAARLEDLDRAGVQMQRAARAMAGVAGRAARVAADPALALSAVVSPGTWLELQRRLSAAVGPPAGAVAVAARLLELAVATRGVGAVYRAADQAVAAGLHAVDVSVGRALAGFVTIPVVASVLTGPVAVTVGAVEVAALAGLVDADAVLAGLAAHPRLVEHSVAALPGLLDGLTDLAPAGPLLLLPVTGTASVPLDVPGAAHWVGRLASTGPWLRESSAVTVTRRPVPDGRAPHGCADLVQGIASLDPDLGAVPGTVRVTTLRRPDGGRAHVVRIPGTQNWSPRAGSDPFDLTGDVQGMAGTRTAGRLLLVEALREAGVRPGEPVMLVGHSQGGLVAAQAACDPEFRASFTVTHVVTAGAPVGASDVPDDVQVLALEHDEDLIPRTDGSPNPDRPGWLTVSAPTAAAGRTPDASVAHRLSSYVATGAAVDGSADPGLAAWRAGAQRFFDGPGVTTGTIDVTGRRAP